MLAFFRYGLMLFSLLLAGCSSFGPYKVHDWGPYSSVVQDNRNQQLLRNLVQIRYAESISFLNLTNITASYTLNPSASLNAGYTTTNTTMGSSTITRNLGLTPTISYSETPTISYVPVANKLFITELLTPIKIEDISHLFFGGIRPSRTLFRLLIQKAGTLDNAYTLSALKPESLPRFKEFYRFINLYYQLSQRGLVKIIPVKISGTSALVIHFEKSGAYSHEARQMRRLFKLPPNNQDIVFVESDFAELSTSIQSLAPQSTLISLKDNVVYLKFRSIIGVMNYLSHGVIIPECDIRCGYATRVYYPDGRPYDWRPLLGGIMTIYSCDKEPRNAYVKTTSHGHWFYIKDSDINSKISLDLLNLLITLKAGDQMNGVNNMPLLTLPATGSA